MTTADRMLFGSAENHASQQSLRGLDWLNLFLAGVLTGFGPFVALYLAGRSWTKVEIGLVLTVSGLTGLLIQVPGGELLDVVRSKRPLVALGVATIACAALILALWPSFTPVLIAEVLLGMTGGFLGPAVAAISLGLVGNDGLPERLGRNQRFAAIGGFGAAALMGLLGYLFSNQAIFFASAALAFPTLVALGRIRADDIHFARACGAPHGDYHPHATSKDCAGSRRHELSPAHLRQLHRLVPIGQRFPAATGQRGIGTRPRIIACHISTHIRPADYGRHFGSVGGARCREMGSSAAAAYRVGCVTNPCGLSRAR